MNLEKTVAVVTGGGTGIGRAVSLALARAGADAVVVNFNRSQAEAEETAAQAREWAGRSRPAAADVADDLQVRAMADQVLATFGRVDI
ncbi:SDR family NAD(P)-dependent oxidoreductase, partial [Plantactinospora solaniradicis]